MDWELKPIGINKYRLEPVPGMRVEAVVYVKEQMIPSLKGDRSLEQLAQSAMLPRVISPVMAMPDVHEGYGIPVGGVMATEGLISVGGVGMDINCGVRCLRTNLEYSKELFSRELLIILSRAIERAIPVGLGEKRKHELARIELKKVVIHGAQHLLKAGYATELDIEHTEENGKLKGADWDCLSERALRRAKNQLGTLGSGNHFIEIQKVSEIFDEKLAAVFGLRKNQICLMLHSGSRALGHQTCLDYNRVFYQNRTKYGIEVPTYNLASLPIETNEGQRYFGAMAGAVNFAFANRQLMTYFLRQVVTKFFEKKVKEPVKVETVYDVAHNIAKWEIHHGQEVLVHRKGATRALPAGHPQNPKAYQKSGHPVLVPGSMATGSYILVGLAKAEESFFTVNHGAGRRMSRRQAKREISKERFEEEMKGVVYNRPFHVIQDEAPAAYKDVNLVVETLVEAGLTKKVARLMPLAVIKGN
jgi:tRNA-splicing ligase RtcB